MVEDPSRGRVSWKRQFPILRLIEIPRLALSPFSLIVAAAAAFLIANAETLIDRILPFPPPNAEVAPILEPFTGRPISDLPLIQYVQFPVSGPWTSTVVPVMRSIVKTSSWSGRLNSVTRGVIGLTVWSLVGLFLARRAACEMAGYDKSTLQSSIHFSRRRWLAALTAPLIPSLLTLVIGFGVAAAALLGRLPYLGSVWFTAISPLMLLAGEAMAMLLLVTMLTWPVMVAAIAVDDTDSFGGLSRSYSGLIGRPWHFLVYLVISVLLGQLLLSLINVLQQVAVWSVLSFAAHGAGEEAVRHSLMGPLTFLVRYLLAGVGVSYFWSAAGVIYLLMRLEVDGVPVERVAPDDADRPASDPLPVVGIPATDARNETNGGGN